MDNLPVQRDGAQVPAPREGFAGFQVTGRSPGLWLKLRSQFVAKVEQLVEQDAGLGWLQEQAKEFGTLALEHAKARLRREGAEVEKIEAEVAKLFAEKEKVFAEARKTNAEARSLEIKNSMMELRVALGFTRAMLIGDPTEEAVVFGQQIDAMIDALKAVSESRTSGA
jgi:hypothetical protein